MPLLNLSSVLIVRSLYSLAKNLAFSNLTCFASINVLSIRNSVLLVYRPIMLNELLL
jgi:hypothetical protein